MRTTCLSILCPASLFLAVSAGCDWTESPPLSILRPAEASLQVLEDCYGHVQFVEDFATGREQVLQSGKPMLLFFSARECVYCRQMLEGAFRDRHVVQLSEQFVCVRIEVDPIEDLDRDFRIEAFPTVLFISPHGALLNRLVGKTEAVVLVSQMEAALRGPQPRTAYRGGFAPR